jgi:hypothetical protein
MTDQSFHEIQLSGKQLVFVFMSAVVVAVGFSCWACRSVAASRARYLARRPPRPRPGPRGDRAGGDHSSGATGLGGGAGWRGSARLGAGAGWDGRVTPRYQRNMIGRGGQGRGEGRRRGRGGDERPGRAAVRDTVSLEHAAAGRGRHGGRRAGRAAVRWPAAGAGLSPWAGREEKRRRGRCAGGMARGKRA